MGKDVGWKTFFSDNARYADVINGIGCGGEQYVKPTDLEELDTASGRKARDLLRKTAFGMNFAIIGIENQDEVDYEFPLRNLHYEVSRYEYEKQAAAIRREVKSRKAGKTNTEAVKLRPGEYLYGFRKTDRLYPVVTFAIYAGKKPWDGALHLHDIINFTDIPEKLRTMVADYSVNFIDVRRMKGTSVFKTDVRYVFDFIWLAEKKKELLDLVTAEPYYSAMDEEAYEVVANYANLKDIINIEIMEETGGKKDMCKAIRDLMEDSRSEGIEIGIERGIERGMERGMEQKKLEIARNLIGLLSDEIIAEKTGLLREKVRELHKMSRYDCV